MTPATPLDQLRLFGPDMRANPYPVYRRLRSEDPVHWHAPLDTWVLTRYHDVAAVLTDLRFSSASCSTPAGSPRCR